MPVKLNSSGGGAVTLDVPVTASNFTLNLPAQNGTIVGADGSGNVSVTGNLSFNSGFGSTAIAYGCRAWVSFNGTGTVAIRGSAGVSSITDNATGDYTINLSPALPDINYSAPISFSGESGARMSQTDLIAATGAASTRTTTALRVCTGIHGVGSYDCAFVNVAFFR